MTFDEDVLRRLESLRLAVRRARGREGDRPTPRRGGAAEFVAHRTYTVGDEIRSIDWHVYARLGQLFVRERSREEEPTLHLVIDASASMQGKLEIARRIAAGLAIAVLAEGGRVVAGGRTFEQLPSLLETLEGASGGEFPERGFVAYFSDLWDERAREPLVAAREAAVIHVLTPEELRPPAMGRARLRDVETGDEIERFVGEEELAKYAELLAAHCESWKRWCREHGMSYVRCASDAPWFEVVTVTLREAGVIE